MPTQNGVNYLLQLLIDFEIWRISDNKNQKWTFYVILSFYLYLIP